MSEEKRWARWEGIREVGPAELADPLLEVHWAAQVIAAAGQNFAEPSEDDSHRAMSWSDAHDGFVGAELAGSYPFRVGLRVTDLTLFLLDRTEETLGSLPLSGRTLDDGYDWLTAAMATYTGSLPVVERPEYDMPEHTVGSGGTFAGDRDAERRTIAALYGTANEMLELYASIWENASPVLCWPHHFDLATLVTYESDAEGNARTVGAGLAPYGGGLDEWYWYVTPYPYPETESLPDPWPGEWHTEGWVGVVATGAKVTQAEGVGAMTGIRTYLSAAKEACEVALGLREPRHPPQ